MSDVETVEVPLPESEAPIKTPKAKGLKKIKAKAAGSKAAKAKATSEAKAEKLAHSADPIPSMARLREVADLFKMASDPTRIHVLATLVGGEQNVTTLCESVAIIQPAVSHHLALMRASKILVARRDGKHNYYSMTPLGRTIWQSAARLLEKTA